MVVRVGPRVSRRENPPKNTLQRLLRRPMSRHLSCAVTDIPLRQGRRERWHHGSARSAGGSRKDRATPQCGRPHRPSCAATVQVPLASRCAVTESHTPLRGTWGVALGERAVHRSPVVRLASGRIRGQFRYQFSAPAVPAAISSMWQDNHGWPAATDDFWSVAMSKLGLAAISDVSISSPRLIRYSDSRYGVGCPGNRAPKTILM